MNVLTADNIYEAMTWYNNFNLLTSAWLHYVINPVGQYWQKESTMLYTVTDSHEGDSQTESTLLHITRYLIQTDNTDNRDHYSDNRINLAYLQSRSHHLTQFSDIM